jgi:F-type H+-transporting ATPase subunit epsilon
MAEKFQFELVSPERLLLSEPVDMVVVPGGDGNFGVLAGHSLLISTVRPGVLDVYEGQSVTQRIFVAGGFAEVTPERCTVLADEAVPVEQLDAAVSEAQIRDLEAAASNLRDQVARTSGAEHDATVLELRGVEHRLEVAAARLAAVRGATTH